MLNIIKKIKQHSRKRKLIQQGVLTPIKSFEQYTNMVKDSKENSKQRLFSNCYMLPNEIKRLILLKSFYSVKTDNGVAFVDDEYSYYYMFLYVDLTKQLTLAKLDKDILIENVYYEGRKTENQDKFEEIIQNAGGVFSNTYKAMADRAQLSPEKYWKNLSALEKSLALEGKKISVPTHQQLRQYEEIYHSTIDRFVQKKYTKKERKQQADSGYLFCVTDDNGTVYAISAFACVHGGVIAARKDCQGGVYAPALVFSMNRAYYKNMPKAPDAQKEYMRCKGVGGWIAVDNAASWRLHKAIGIFATGKSMTQLVLSAQEE